MLLLVGYLAWYSAMCELMGIDGVILHKRASNPHD